MADQFDDDEQEIDVPELDAEDEEQEQDAEQSDEESEEEEGGEEAVFFAGDEPAKGSDSELVKHLRETITTLRRDGAAQRKAPVNEVPIVVGEKPTLATCEYDEERFEVERDAYDDRVRAKAEQDRRLDEAKRQQDNEWQEVTRAYAEKKRALKFPDVNQAEADAFALLDDTQQAIIARIADNPAKLIYALGKSPVKLAAVSKITNPLLLTKEITKLEATLTTKQGKRPPDPQPVLRGRPITASRDKTLEKLEKQADESGDRTELIAYKRKLKAA